MYLAKCRSARCLAVLHKIYKTQFGFNDVHQREASLSSSTAGCRSCQNCNQNSITRILPPLLQLNPTLINTCWPSDKSTVSHLKAFKPTSIRRRDLNKDWWRWHPTAFHNSRCAIHECLQPHWNIIWQISVKEYKSDFQTTNKFYLVCLFFPQIGFAASS